MVQTAREFGSKKDYVTEARAQVEPVIPLNMINALSAIILIQICLL